MKVTIRFANSYKDYKKGNFTESETYPTVDKAYTAIIDRNCNTFASAWKEKMLGKTEDFLALAAYFEARDKLSKENLEEAAEQTEVYHAEVKDGEIEISLYYSLK